MTGLLHDLRYGVRLLVRAPAFSLATTLTIALGVGAVTAVLTVVYALVLRPLDLPDPERLVALSEVQETAAGEPYIEGSFSRARYLEYEEASAPAFSGLAAHHYREMSLRDTGGGRSVLTVVASENYFRVLGLSPTAGRFFQSGGSASLQPAEVVLGHSFWRSAFGESEAVLGSTLVLDGHAYTVVGVAPKGFGGIYRGFEANVFVPLSVFHREHPLAESRSEVWAEQLWLSLFGRLAEGVPAEAAVGRLGLQFAGVPAVRSFGDGGGTVRGVESAPLRPIPEWMHGSSMGFGGMLLVTALLVLLIAATNVAGMVLARGTARRREISIRLALCAGRGQVVRQLVTESLLLFVLGGVLGIGLAMFATGILSGALPGMVSGVPLTLDLSTDPAVLSAALALMLATGLVFGSVPAVQVTRPDLLSGLKDSYRPGPVGGAGRLRGTLVVLQLSLSLVLLLVASLFVHAARRAASLDPGFDTDRLAVASVNLAQHGYDETRGAEFYRELLERIRSKPGVEHASLAQFPHLSGNVSRLPLRVPGGPLEARATSYSLVAPGWFETVGTEIMEGRRLTEADATGGAVVVNETLARRYWPGASPLGRTLAIEGDVFEVVGLARDAQYESLTAPPEPHLYLPFGARYAAAMTIHVRSADPGAALAAVRSAVREIDPDLALRQTGTFSERLDLLLMPQRAASVLIGLFGVVGLGLAATGLFGILSFHVEQQRREIALRVALGGNARVVLRMVLARVAKLVAAGIVLGIAGAALLLPLVQSFLLGIGPLDSPTLFLGPLLLIAVASAAAWVPARRALRVDPMTLLRVE